MEKGEPTFVPEWLKSSGSLSTTSHQFQSSALHSDRTTSSYFRRTSSSNGSSHLRSYGSFGRYSDKEKSENRHRDYSDPLGNILPSRFEKEGLRRSHSSVSAKRGESWPKKVVADVTIGNKSSYNNGGTSRSGVGGNSGGNSGVKNTFESHFPSLKVEDKRTDTEIGRIPSPGLSSAIQSLPIGSTAVIGGDGWTSALAEVPVIVGSNGSNASVVQTVQSTSVSATASLNSGRNMAETLAHGSPRAQTAPQLSVGPQRLEELAVKQSRQLIPMTPPLPKALALNSSDKSKPKVAQLQVQGSHVVNHAHSFRPISTKSESIKTSTLGKLQILKPSREKNCVTPIAMDNLSPTGGSKLPNSPLSVPSVVGPAPLRNHGNNPPISIVDRKPGVTISEKKPSSQARSRNDFFNLMRKKSVTPATGPSESASDKHGEYETPTVTEGVHESVAVDGSGGSHESSEKKDDVACNGDADVATERFTSDNERSNVSCDAILYSEEEEARFLRSLGWEETTDEEEGLTEEEISSFYRDVSKYLTLQTESKIFNGTQPKLLMPLHTHMGKNGDVSSDS
ncbi:uncharacterized protein [Rutidosis leptorrhynchoides]|uniref:uncharacterized protein isoform X2 n=1 Tax=Rutidosis leptorrhynchoides TaxID=125765 RepID=UPI003A9A60E7